MDLILWRHAEAIELAESGNDMDRHLTPKGERQAARMSIWLDRVLPQGTRIFCSPATRCEQTVMALGRRYKLREELSPNGQAQEVLDLVQWPVAKGAVMVVGHQPYLGQVVAKLFDMKPGECSIKKASVWWIKTKAHESVLQTSLHAVQSADLV
ncbi:MAG: histidine phosphatase family protein [Betaproteobacteria bacterium]|jgi:phosphohistidine phosphatase